jgi:hypothetical protein
VHRSIFVQAGVLARCHGNMGEIFAGGAEIVHMTLGREGVIGDSREMAPWFLPVFVAVTNRTAG